MATKFDPEVVKASADRIGSIMHDMSAFSALKPHWPDAGKFELAAWLERIVDDRRNGVVAHADYLKIAMERMRVGLTKIAEDFQNADGENADRIRTSITDLQAKIADGVGRLAEETEAREHNFTSAGGNVRPDDGYSQPTKPASAPPAAPAPTAAPAPAPKH
ncbi:hypothetical protein [Lentzea sp. NPDC059081]|uniref:hypothetical protein n=1 Tax=Lentzea sp. NPDC059081 TaxID=3346719 RepID=UPI00368381DB